MDLSEYHFRYSITWQSPSLEILNNFMGILCISSFFICRFRNDNMDQIEHSGRCRILINNHLVNHVFISSGNLLLCWCLGRPQQLCTRYVLCFVLLRFGTGRFDRNISGLLDRYDCSSAMNVIQKLIGKWITLIQVDNTTTRTRKFKQNKNKKTVLICYVESVTSGRFHWFGRKFLYCPKNTFQLRSVGFVNVHIFQLLFLMGL